MSERETRLASKNPTGHLAVNADGRVYTVPTGQPLKKGSRWATNADVKAAEDLAKRNEAEAAQRANRERLIAEGMAAALLKAADGPAQEKPAGKPTKE